MAQNGRKRARLRFTATLGGVKVVPPKKESGYYNAGEDRYTGGGFDITLHVNMPEDPKKPHDYRWNREEPALQKRQKDMSDAEWEAYQRRHDELHAEWRQLQEEKARALERYRRQVETLAARRLSYMQIVGLASMLGPRPVSVTIEPENTDLLPGFEAVLADAAEEADQIEAGEPEEMEA